MTDKNLREEITKIAQDLFMQGDEGEFEENAVPYSVDKLLSLFETTVSEVIGEDLVAKEGGIDGSNHGDNFWNGWTSAKERQKARLKTLLK